MTKAQMKEAAMGEIELRIIWMTTKESVEELEQSKFAIKQMLIMANRCGLITGEEKADLRRKAIDTFWEVYEAMAKKKVLKDTAA